jgi:hypothetical protein
MVFGYIPGIVITVTSEEPINPADSVVGGADFE